LWPAVLKKGANDDRRHHSPLSCFQLFRVETFKKTRQGWGEIEAMNGDGMSEDEENEKPKPSREILAWRHALWAGIKISNNVSRFR